MKRFHLPLAIIVAVIAGLFGFKLFPFRPAEGRTAGFPPGKSVPAVRPISEAPAVPVVRSRPTAEPLPEPPAEPATRLANALEQLPPDEQASLHAAIHEARHAIEPLRDTLPRNPGVSHFAANPGQDITARFLENGGVRFESGIPGKTWQGTLRLKDAAGGGWRAESVRAELDHGSLTEWYVNRADGFEHGFTVRERPGDLPADGPLVLRMTLEELRADHDPGREGDLIFTNPLEDRAVLGYRDLKVWDATGRELGARMRPAGDGFLIAVNDHGAKYPVTVDPLIVSLEAEIREPIPRNEDYFGHFVALDGNRLVVTAPGADDAGRDAGAVYIFRRISAGNWSFSQKILQEPFPASDHYEERKYFGLSAAMIGDTLAITSQIVMEFDLEDPFPYDSINILHIYQLSGESHQHLSDFFLQRYVPEADPDFLPMRRHSLAMTGDQLAFGAELAREVLILRRQGENWIEDLRVNEFSVPGSTFGHSVAIGSGMVAVSSPQPGNPKIHFYRKSGSLWLDPAELPIPSGLANGDGFGEDLAFAGNRLFVGAPGRDFSSLAQDIGGIFQFFWNGSSWTGEGEIHAPEPQPGEQFGYRLQASGNLILTASHPGVRRVHFLELQGAATVHRQVLESPSGGTNRFGFSLGLSGDDLVIGAPSTSTHGASLNGAAFAYRRAGNEWVAPQQLAGDMPGRAAPGNEFGAAVAIDGDTAVIGSPNSDTALASDAGAALVFRRSGGGWNPEGVLVDEAPATGDRFGISVAISGNRVVVGADNDTEEGKAGRGSATIFERDGGGVWQRRNKLGAEAAAGDSFGRAVAIDGDTVAAGAPLKNTARGRVWVYTLGAGSSVQVQEITPPASAAQVRFGFSLALSGDRMIAGAPRWDHGTIRTGRVFFYRRAPWGWVADGEHGPSGAGTGDYRAGFSVALDGDVAVVGCSGPISWTGGGGNGAGRTGRAFALTHDGTSWGGLTWLDNSGVPAGAWFGMSVAVKGDVIAAGIFSEIVSPGTIRLFRRNGTGWDTLEDLQTGIASGSDGFGLSVALDGDILLAGAPYMSNSHGTYAGSAFVFRVTDPDAVVPELTITRSGGNAVLTWTPAPGWTLWQSPSLAPGSWTQVTVATDGTHSHPVSSAPRMFFRLQK